MPVVISGSHRIGGLFEKDTQIVSLVFLRRLSKHWRTPRDDEFSRLSKSITSETTKLNLKN